MPHPRFTGDAAAGLRCGGVFPGGFLDPLDEGIGILLKLGQTGIAAEFDLLARMLDDVWFAHRAEGFPGDQADIERVGGDFGTLRFRFLLGAGGEDEQGDGGQGQDGCVFHGVNGVW